MVNLEITRLDANEDGFSKALARKLDWASVSDQKVISSVTGIIEDVRTRGDEALLEYTGQFDGLSVQSAGELVLGRERIRQALASVSPEKRQALELAARHDPDPVRQHVRLVHVVRGEDHDPALLLPAQQVPGVAPGPRVHA